MVISQMIKTAQLKRTTRKGLFYTPAAQAFWKGLFTATRWRGRIMLSRRCRIDRRLTLFVSYVAFNLTAFYTIYSSVPSLAFYPAPSLTLGTPKTSNRRWLRPMMPLCARGGGHFALWYIILRHISWHHIVCLQRSLFWLVGLACLSIS